MTGADVQRLADDLGLDGVTMARLLGVEARSWRRWTYGRGNPTGGASVVAQALRAALDDAGERRAQVAEHIASAAKVGGLGQLVYRGIQQSTKTSTKGAE